MLLIERSQFDRAGTQNLVPAETHPTNGRPASYLVDGPQSGPAVGHPEPNAGTSWAELSQPASSGTGDKWATPHRRRSPGLNFAPFEPDGARVNLWVVSLRRL